MTKNPASTARDIRNHRTAVSTKLGLISCDYLDPSHWRSNQWPQNAEPKLYHWATGPLCTQALPNKLVKENARPINSMCLVVSSVLLQRTRSPPGPRLCKSIGETHPFNHNFMDMEIDIHFFIFHWWDLKRSKQLSSGSVCHVQC